MTQPSGMEDHPEGLLSLAVAGKLDEPQRQALLEHVAHCRPCATQVRIAGWMTQASAGKLALAHLRDRATVSRVMARFEASNSPRRGSLFPRWASLAPRWVLVGSTVAFAFSGAAAGASWWATRAVLPQPNALPTLASTPRKTGKAQPRAPKAELPAPSEAARPEAPASELDGAPANKRPESKAQHATEGAEAAEATTASALFARASELRLNGQGLAAIAQFERIQKLHPNSRESQISHLVVGRLWLDNGRPELAAPEFARYFKSGGAANEEALVGHATALRRMGRSAEEVADWKRLLEKHPGSVYAAEARKRLDALKAE